MEKLKPQVLLVGSVVVLLCAYGIGLAIRNIRFMLAETKSQAQVTQPEQRTEIGVDEPVPAAAPEIEYVVEQEPVEELEDEFVETAEEQWEVEPENQWAQDEIQSDEGFRNGQSGGNMQWGGGQEWFDWANNLTEEQRTRLERGMMSMWQRWQNLSDEEAEAERSRMMEMGQRWWNMTDTERQQAMQRMQQQFQQWLESDQEELPVFSLD